jgi:sarcosine oxidase/L-pipecolate oxidase
MSTASAAQVGEFDVAIVGGGPIGLATAYECAKKGKKVVLFERFVFFNQSGSSADITRMYRTMYTESYMAEFMYHAIDAWEKLINESGEGFLLWKTGLLNFGDPNYGAGGPEGTLTGPIANLRRYNMDFRTLNSAEIMAEYPFRNLPDNFIGVFASENGCINVPLLLRTLHKLCAVCGVTLVQNARVNKVDTTGHGSTIDVTITNGSCDHHVKYHAKKVAITAGAYVNHILKPSYNFSLKLDIWEMVYEYYSVNPGPDSGAVFKSMWFQFKDNDNNDSRASNLIYGFPALPWGTPNLCRIAVDNAVNVIKDPEMRGLSPACNDLYRTQKFLEQHLPGIPLQPANSGTCLQANLPDNMYGLGYIPDKYLPQGGSKDVVVFSAGWAMKAVPLIGRIIAEMLDDTLDRYSPSLAGIVNDRFSLDRDGVIDDDDSSSASAAMAVTSTSKASSSSHAAVSIVAKVARRPRLRQFLGEFLTQRLGSSNGVRLTTLAEAFNIPAHIKSPREIIAALWRKRAQTHSLTSLSSRVGAGFGGGRFSARSSAANMGPVGIIGAGMAGLYAAMILKSLGIPYHILEANPDRCGGRVFTYRFNEHEEHDSTKPAYYDYIDMGAMRHPPLKVMDRVIGDQHWSLVSKLNQFAEDHGHPNDRVVLVPYFLSDPNNNEFNLYNGTLLRNREMGPRPDGTTPDYFRFGDQYNGGPGTGVPDEYVAVGSGALLDNAVKPFLDMMDKNFGNGFDALAAVDNYSTRQYLAEKTKLPNQECPCEGYPQSAINYIETFDTGTGLFDEAFSETVIDCFDFEETDVDESGKKRIWQCTNGGMDRFVASMLKYLAHDDAGAGGSGGGTKKRSRDDSSGSSAAVGRGPKRAGKSHGQSEGTALDDDSSSMAVDSGSGSHHSDVSADGVHTISADCWVTKIAPNKDKTSLEVEYRGATASSSHPPSKTFRHVINTAPLSIVRNMDLSQCDLSLRQRDAIRLMHYDFSCKLALRFKSRFWEAGSAQEAIVGGVSNTDNPLRVIVYPSYGLDLPKGAHAPGVMICSYTWAQDASRAAALFGASGGNRQHDVFTARRDEAVQLCLGYLAQLHGEVVYQQYDDAYYFQDWYDDQYSQGAFALYGPSHFKELFPHITQPAANGLLHFAGEATSVHHAWIVGALNSAYRAVYQILDFENLAREKEELVKQWGIVEEVEYGDFNPVPATEEADRTDRADRARRAGLRAAAHPILDRVREHANVGSVAAQGRSILRCRRI